jgi:hypothetical protein
LGIQVNSQRSLTIMYQCSHCTGGCSATTIQPVTLCRECHQVPIHICTQCRFLGSVATCYLCTWRDHVCLSMCSKKCIWRVAPQCECDRPARRRVSKSDKNPNRAYWSCQDCGYFEWGGDDHVRYRIQDDISRLHSTQSSSKRRKKLNSQT